MRERRPWRERLDEAILKTPSGCWEFQGPKSPKGYGSFWTGTPHRKSKAPAHRISWELVNGPVPEGKILCHACDNRPCVNPAHLFVGTKGDNNRDRNAKGRDSRGARHPNSKLTPDLVRLIRRLSAQGIVQREIATRVGVSRSCVACVVTRQNWKHVTDEEPAR
jgi:hypothetical protein